MTFTGTAVVWEHEIILLVGFVGPSASGQEDLLVLIGTDTTAQEVKGIGGRNDDTFLGDVMSIYKTYAETKLKRGDTFELLVDQSENTSFGGAVLSVLIDYGVLRKVENSGWETKAKEIVASLPETSTSQTLPGG